MFDKFLIAPLNSGLQQDVKPFLIPDDAFERLNNAYVFRGRVRKRFGSTAMNTSVASAIQPLSSRLRIKLSAATGTVPGAEFGIGQMFSVGSEMLTVASTGTPTTLLTTGGGITGTYNTTTGAYVITGSGATDIYFYPATSVMGFANYEAATLNEEDLFAFDTQFAYKYSSGAWARLTTGTDIWTGTDSDFFWSVNYRGINSYDILLFVTNFVEADGIRYWNGTTWTKINPAYLTGAGNTIETCRLIVPFKDRLLLLNTIEQVGGVSEDFPNRCRFCQNGSPLAADAWREDVDGKGDHIDCPIKEAIVGAQLIRDRLIVFFERSTWEIAYTQNQVLPFVWQQVNIELGAESTFSIVPFDKVILGVGNTGVHACTGANVERIDTKIPDEVFDFHSNATSVLRVQGIRDYVTELVYWAVPNKDNFAPYPDRILVYNYVNNSWAFNDDSVTAFGYNNSVHESVVAGNQTGFTFIVDSNIYKNAVSNQISDIKSLAGTVTLTIKDHNLKSGDYIAIENCLGITSLNDKIYKVNYLTTSTVTLVNPPTVTGTYTGRGTIRRVSQIDILTKQYNFYLPEGNRVYLARVDFYVDKTTYGQMLIDSSPSSSSDSMIDDGTTTGALLGTNILETSPYTSVPLEATQTRFWHKIYFQSEGECVQMRLYLSDSMMLDPNIAWSNFELNGMVIYVMKTKEF